ncbi:C6 transcription factor [Sporothrix schenckii 1099-18]|uniref:C6 transcription factor n=1 Tax=Sporothrix schenckii 1099-18 TaxID=1397361 RepID=A0A0F2MIW7_SPOSC|nr:C6 transcription factor [Sporothrix schenckii 1099-18]KJR88116.1 C6 transcription factor [Sporothrix schenckii 1099-18]
MDSRSPPSSTSDTGSATTTAPIRAATATSTTSPAAITTSSPLKDKHRVSRACISCRQRKTRCDLYSHGTPGQPPCTRCFQERLECTLATSRRGGRRPRRTDVNQNQGRARAPPQLQSRGSGSGLPPSSPHLGTHASTRRATVHMTGADIDGDFAARDLLNPSDALNLLAQVADLDGDHDEQDQSHGGAYNAGDGHNDAQPGTPTPAPHHRHPHHNDSSENANHSHNLNTSFYYPPISDGRLSLADASYLLQHYHEHYHPFFPVADKRVFDGRSIASLVEAEPHLLTSIFTVASKDDPAWHGVHEACASHMDNLVSRLISRGSSSVGAVEALLILAEWAPQLPQSTPQPTPRPESQSQGQSRNRVPPDPAPALIGRGEEDQGAWMQIGVAIRLAYLQGLEQTGLVLGNNNKPTDFERKRVAWAACYMSDREVSIRLGKGFWSRGPGPSTVLSAGDFPTLRAQQAGAGDLAELFQARLEMTQLFSNAHDILYSSTTHREQLFVGGDTVTRSVKAALILSYEFLRLYINAFAFQATISRAITRARQSPPASRTAVRPLFTDLASIPDARFIYESIDAANTLLSTLNDFVDPTSALCYMPLKYYLYVIYAAVFLFKARVAGALAGDSGISARRTINVTIDRLQKSSVHPHGLGQRYARSLYLLWRKSVDRAAAQKTKKTEKAADKTATTAGTAVNTPVGRDRNGDHNSSGPQSPAPSSTHSDTIANGTHSNVTNLDVSSIPTGTTMAVDTDIVANGVNDTSANTGVPPDDGRPPAAELLDPLKGFSWRDLDGLGQFIGNDMNFLDLTLATPMTDSDHGAAAVDTVTDAWQDILWSGNDVIF